MRDKVDCGPVHCEQRRRVIHRQQRRRVTHRQQAQMLRERQQTSHSFHRREQGRMGRCHLVADQSGGVGVWTADEHFSVLEIQSSPVRGARVATVTDE